MAAKLSADARKAALGKLKGKGDSLYVGIEGDGRPHIAIIASILLLS